MEPTNDRLRVELVRGVMIVHLLDGQIEQSFGEANDVEELDQSLNLLVDRGAIARLLLDFGEVEYVVSLMQAKLLRLGLRLRCNGGQLRLCGLRPVVAQSFQVTGLSRQFAIHPDVNSALDAFESGR